MTTLEGFNGDDFEYRHRAQQGDVPTAVITLNLLRPSVASAHHLRKAAGDSPARYRLPISMLAFRVNSLQATDRTAPAEAVTTTFSFAFGFERFVISYSQPSTDRCVFAGFPAARCSTLRITIVVVDASSRRCW